MATGVLNKHASFNSVLLIIYIIVLAVNSYTYPQMDFFKRLTNAEKLRGIPIGNMLNLTDWEEGHSKFNNHLLTTSCGQSTVE